MVTPNGHPDPAAAQPLRRRQVHAEAVVAAMHAKIAPAVGEAVRRCSVATDDGPRITPRARVQVLGIVDAELDRIYGRTSGGSSPLADLTVAEANAARLAAIAPVVQRMRRKLPGKLRARMGDPDAAAQS